MYDPSWIITEPVMVTRVDDADDHMLVRVRSMTDAAGSYREVELLYDGTGLTFNTVRVDVGDDLMAYLSVMDEAGEAEPGTWAYSEPYPDDDEIKDAVERHYAGGWAQFLKDQP